MNTTILLLFVSILSSATQSTDILYKLQIGDVYTYKIEYGEKSPARNSVACLLKLTSGKKDIVQDGKAEKELGYLLQFKMTDFGCTFQDDGMGKKLTGNLGKMKSFAFSASMDSTGRVYACDLEKAWSDLKMDDQAAKDVVLSSVVQPIVAGIWSSILPMVDRGSTGMRSGWLLLKDRDWSASGVGDGWRILYCGPVGLRFTPEKLLDKATNRLAPTGRLLLWRDITEVTFSKEFGDSMDVVESHKQKLVFADGVFVEGDEEVRHAEAGSKEPMAVFFAARLVEQQEQDK